jgi:hypothetical protein
MDKATLVSADIDKGEKVVSALESSGFRVNVALWANFSDYEDPRLVLASRNLDDQGPLNSYRVALDALAKHNMSGHWGSSLLILRMNDPFIKDLRRIFSPAADVKGMRLGGQSFGGRYVLDAYVYRIR